MKLIQRKEVVLFFFLTVEIPFYILVVFLLLMNILKLMCFCC